MPEVIEAPAPAAPAKPAAPAAPAARSAPAAPAKPAAPAAPAAEESASGYWPEDWRDKVSKGDANLLKRFERYASPDAALSALVAAQNRISSGELRTTLPKEATPEEVAAWRKDNGIPEKPDGYDLEFGDGLVISDTDKPIIDSFLSKAHTANMPPEQVKTAVAWYYDEMDRQAAARADQDEKDRTTALDALNTEWGQSFRRNINLINGVLDKFPEAVRDNLKAARLPDGQGIFNNPEIMRGFMALALENNPSGVVVPAGVANPMQNIEERLAAMDKLMGNKNSEYWKGSKAEAMQAEYRDLIDAREAIKAKTSKAA